MSTPTTTTPGSGPPPGRIRPSNGEERADALPRRIWRDRCSTPRNLHEQLELANLLYREFQNRCFWHSRATWSSPQDLIPFVVKGLRTYGGHRGFKLAAKLQIKPGDLPNPERELLECR